MSMHFERTGPLTQPASYPPWTQDMVAACAMTKARLLDHELWTLMTSLELDERSTGNFMRGAGG